MSLQSIPSDADLLQQLQEIICSVGTLKEENDQLKAKLQEASKERDKFQRKAEKLDSMLKSLQIKLFDLEDKIEEKDPLGGSSESAALEAENAHLAEEQEKLNARIASLELDLREARNENNGLRLASNSPHVSALLAKLQETLKK
jgi:FtsZ-binding cell division protein ZapB